MTEDIAKAVRILREGGLVAFPTETVYGLGADARKKSAVQKIFAAKHRPPSNPLIVHVADAKLAKRYTDDEGWQRTPAQLLGEKFWPGPLTLVVRKSSEIVHQATAGRQTVGLRVPNHPLALELLYQFNGPIAAPSANRSTHVSPTTAQHVRDELGDSVDFILDGGPCSVGIESTVLDLTTPWPTILRPGAITAEQLEPVIGAVRIASGSIDPRTPAASPGQHAVHYAPRAPAFRFDRFDFHLVVDWTRTHTDSYSAILPLSAPSNLLSFITHPLHVIHMPRDPAKYARVLYSTVRDLDARSISIIFIEMPPDEPQWLAIRDRLLRATRPLPRDL